MGHVAPNLALIEHFQSLHWETIYIGSCNGLEKKIIHQIAYYGVSTGKFHRYLTWKNLLTPFKVLWGMLQATYYCYRLKPNVVFSKGGFVAFPVVFGAWVNRIPVMAHESDFTPGLANRLSYPFVKCIGLSFPETKKAFKKQDKLIVTGTPIRKILFQGDAVRGRERCGFTQKKPILLILGGSLGAHCINQAVRMALPELTQHDQVIHICGPHKMDSGYSNHQDYCQYEAVYDRDFADLLACADRVVSRAGANAIQELLTLKKCTLFIPLSKRVSRGDQIQNACYYCEKGWAEMMGEEDLTPEALCKALDTLSARRQAILKQLETQIDGDGLHAITTCLLDVERQV